MDRKKRIFLILTCIITAILVLRLVWIYTPSEGKVIYHVQETGVTIEDTLSYEETVAVKKILWGKIQWPEWIYGYPACGFGKIFAVVLDGKIYMPAWDSCGMLAVRELASGNGDCSYVNITQRQKAILEEIITSRDTQ